MRYVFGLRDRRTRAEACAAKMKVIAEELTADQQTTALRKFKRGCAHYFTNQ